MTAAAVDLNSARKHWATLRARFAMRAYRLDRRIEGGYRIAIGTWSIDLSSMSEVVEFAERAGIDVDLAA